MTLGTTKVVGLVLAVVSLGVLGASVSGVAQRLEHRNIKTIRFVGSIPGEHFRFEGIEGEIERIPAEAPGGDAVLRLHWRGGTEDFPIPFADKPGETGLDRYADWFAISMLVEGAESDAELRKKWKTDERGRPGVVPRLVVAARYPAPGAEGAERMTWGLVRRQEWEYRIGELHLDGPADEAIAMHRMSYEQLDALYLPGQYTDKRYLLPQAERDEKLWMYYAMQTVTPPSQYRGRNKAQVDMIQVMGWAWPAAVASFLGLVAGVAVFASARVRRPEG